MATAEQTRRGHLFVVLWENKNYSIDSNWQINRNSLMQIIDFKVRVKARGFNETELDGLECRFFFAFIFGSFKNK